MNTKTPTQYVLLGLTCIAFCATLVIPGWYNVVCFLTCMCAFTVHECFGPKPMAQTDSKEIDELKAVVVKLSSTINATATKLSGLRMQIGIRE